MFSTPWRLSCFASKNQPLPAHYRKATAIPLPPTKAQTHYTLTLDDKALLETERGKVREFRKLDALASLVKELGVDQFSVSLKPCDGQLKTALANAKR